MLNSLNKAILINTYEISDENHWEKVAEDLFQQIDDNKFLLLEGDLGAGKTTFSKYLVKQIGYTSAISSPTFSIVNQYDLQDDSIYHFDFYRIKNQEELVELGLDEYFYSNKWCILEWADRVEQFLPPSFYILLILHDDNRGRVAKLYRHG